MKYAMAIFCSVVLLGCSKEEARTTANDARDVITQENKVQAAKKAGEDLQRIGAQRDEEMREALGN